MKRKLAFWLLFTAAVALFALQTMQAFGVVAFHADFFEKKGTIVLDAGHGGEDGGAVAINGTMEKDINLAIALELQKLFIQHNFEVIMVRDGDYAVGDQQLNTIAERKRSDTKKRLEIIEQAGECIYLSVHQNHFTESKYYGAQVFYSGNDSRSALLAEAIRENVVNALQQENNRENKEAEENIYLLYNCNVPGVLVECGFLSNPQEAEKLCTPEYQKEMATAIYNGLIDYLENEKKEESAIEE